MQMFVFCYTYLVPGLIARDSKKISHTFCLDPPPKLWWGREKWGSSIFVKIEFLSGGWVIYVKLSMWNYGMVDMKDWTSSNHVNH